MANLTGKGTFQKGEDTRRNQAGQRNKAAVSFARSLREYIVKEGKVALTLESGKKVTKIEAVVRTLYKEAISGNMQAAVFIADRVEGKVKDQLEHSSDPNAPMVLRVLYGTDGTPAPTAPATD